MIPDMQPQKASQPTSGELLVLGILLVTQMLKTVQE